jgi:hypothetical protein
MIMFECSNRTARGFDLNAANSIEFLRSLQGPDYVFHQIGNDGCLVHVQRLRSEHSNLLAVPACHADRIGNLVVGVKRTP